MFISSTSLPRWTAGSDRRDMDTGLAGAHQRGPEDTGRAHHAERRGQGRRGVQTVRDPSSRPSHATHPPGRRAMNQSTASSTLTSTPTPVSVQGPPRPGIRPVPPSPEPASLPPTRGTIRTGGIPRSTTLRMRVPLPPRPNATPGRRHHLCAVPPRRWPLPRACVPKRSTSSGQWSLFDGVGREVTESSE
jgi:hypothetical protein